MLKLERISPSRIKTFDACLFKYWLTYCTDNEMKSNWGGAHGTAVHDILEYYANGSDTNWYKRLLDAYNGPDLLRWAKPKEYNDVKPDCDDCEYSTGHDCRISGELLDELTGCPKKLFEGSVSMISETINRYEDIWKKVLRDPDGNIIGTEYNYEIPLRGTDVRMIGIMDLVVEEDPETIHIIDYKAGKMTQSFQQCRDDIQVRMYSLASRREFIDDINNKGYNYKNIMLTFDYFQSRPITIAFSEEEDNQTEHEVIAKTYEIKQTDTIKRVPNIRTDADFEKRGAWKCKYLCDIEVCKREWKGVFNLEED
jgi:hypothetical protein